MRHLFAAPRDAGVALPDVIPDISACGWRWSARAASRPPRRRRRPVRANGTEPPDANGGPNRTVTPGQAVCSGTVTDRLNPCAERVGFEPTDPGGSAVFKTAAFVHSATAPVERG